LSRQLLIGVGWLAMLLGACGHIWHKWLRDGAPGATWHTVDIVPVSSYVREHVIWWGLFVVGAAIVLIFSRLAKKNKD
jgi:hypothetical protein